jgi:hypothetical protein
MPQVNGWRTTTFMLADDDVSNSVMLMTARRLPKFMRNQAGHNALCCGMHLQTASCGRLHAAEVQQPATVDASMSKSLHLERPVQSSQQRSVSIRCVVSNGSHLCICSVVQVVGSSPKHG